MRAWQPAGMPQRMTLALWDRTGSRYRLTMIWKRPTVFKGLTEVSAHALWCCQPKTTRFCLRPRHKGHTLHKPLRRAWRDAWEACGLGISDLSPGARRPGRVRRTCEGLAGLASLAEPASARCSQHQCKQGQASEHRGRSRPARHAVQGRASVEQPQQSHRARPGPGPGSGSFVRKLRLNAHSEAGLGSGLRTCTGACAVQAISPPDVCRARSPHLLGWPVPRMAHAAQPGPSGLQRRRTPALPYQVLTAPGARGTPKS